jgi:hypothetical protein
MTGEDNRAADRYRNAVAAVNSATDAEMQRVSLVTNNLLYKGPGERLAAMGPGLGRKTDEGK